VLALSPNQIGSHRVRLPSAAHFGAGAVLEQAARQFRKVQGFAEGALVGVFHARFAAGG
jgi:hypothetical protein